MVMYSVNETRVHCNSLSFSDMQPNDVRFCHPRKTE